MKKFFVGVFVSLFGALSIALMMPISTVNAIDCAAEEQKASTAFLSFPTWYRGLGLEEGKDSSGNPTGDCVLKKDAFEGQELGPIVFKIALNVTDMLLRLVGILAVGFVIWGGIRYVMSNGEPEQAKKALDTILKAVIGMVIAMIAAIVVSFIVARLSQ